LILLQYQSSPLFFCSALAMHICEIGVERERFNSFASFITLIVLGWVCFIKTMLQRFLGCYPTPRDACFPLRTCSNLDDNASVVLSMGRPRTVCLRVARNSRGTRRNSRAGLGLSRGLSDSRGSSSVVSLSGLVVSRTRPPLISCSLVFSAQQVSPRYRAR